MSSGLPTTLPMDRYQPLSTRRSAARLNRCRDKAKNSPKNATDATTATVNTWARWDLGGYPPVNIWKPWPIIYLLEMVISIAMWVYQRVTRGETRGETWLLRCQILLIVQQTNEGILRYVTTKIWDSTDPASKEDLLNQPANMMDFCLWMEILPTTMILYSIQSATMVISPAKREWHKHTFWQHHQQVAIGTCIYIYIYIYTYTHAPSPN